MGSYELKPNKTAFVTYAFIKSFIASLLGIFLLWLVLNWFYPGLIPHLTAIILIALSFAYNLFNRQIMYKKTRYVLTKDKIYFETGGIFSNSNTELAVRNITHVLLIRPFIENRLFGTGQVIIQAAGAAGAEISMLSLDDPQAVYKGVQHIMKESGFSLSASKLIQHEKPQPTAAAFESIGSILLILFLLVGYFPGLVVALGAIGIFGNILGLLAIFAIFFFAIVHYLDLINRDYWIYKDVIIYDEGFLTKVDSFLPIENLSDSNTTQTFVDKIFNFYDVTVSCQGTGQEIRFKNIAHGLQMEENISGLLRDSSSLIGKKTSSVQKPRLAIESERSDLAVDSTYSKELRMDPNKMFMTALVAALILSALFIGISLPFGSIVIIGIILSIIVVAAFLIAAAISISANTFYIKPKSFASKHSFMATRDLEFSNEKVTGIQFTRGLFDRMYGTFSVLIMSIGATSDIKFINIPYSDDLKERILSKLGILGEDISYSTESKFSIPEMFKAHIGSFLVLFIVSAALVYLGLSSTFYLILALVIILLALIVIAYKHLFYQTSKLYFHKDYIHASRGVINKTNIYALYDDIKDNQTRKYAFSGLGTAIFNIAGESLQKNGKNSSLRSHGFSVDYLPDISNLDEVIDLSFTKKPNAQEMKQIISGSTSIPQNVITSTRPNLLNTVFNTILFLVVLDIVLFLIFPIPTLYLVLLLVLELVYISFRILQVKSIRYYMEPYRLISEWGVLYKTQKSIIHSKIDHINKRQGPLNKLFGTANIIVNTAGSSLPELYLINLPDFQAFYEMLEKYY
jgi:membrane protein YdbS with pleckstrin-like domain